jgi:hypothetical protein
MNGKNLEQPINITFCVKIGKSASEINPYLRWLMGSTLLRNREFLNCLGGSRKGENMSACFFDHKEIVHYEFIAQGQTVNQQCYLEVLARLWSC